MLAVGPLEASNGHEGDRPAVHKDHQRDDAVYDPRLPAGLQLDRESVRVTLEGCHPDRHVGIRQPALSRLGRLRGD